MSKVRECKCVYSGEPHGIEFIHAPSGHQWAIGGTATQDRWKFCPWCGGSIPKEVFRKVPEMKFFDGIKELDKVLGDVNMEVDYCNCGCRCVGTTCGHCGKLLKPQEVEKIRLRGQSTQYKIGVVEIELTRQQLEDQLKV